ncbi:hypothetical protein V2A60_002947 [Cordyceps javanica]|uniref:Uncharacterized protein n=1 Tax=Cordyceps javanica TaxID=43265 RepID=A0A545W1T7_9HYPO|nr:hypothetical protein IF1G_05251 [Cordyceps javanica]TQW07941.1 transmembrane alpha-helix domain-containing protein [Cordyceps javanica]
MTRYRYPATGAAPCLLFALFFVLIAAPSALAFEANFDFYPKDAQPCLYDAAKASKCQGDSSQALNACFCGNGGSFVKLTAQCLGKKDKKDVAKVYDTMADACGTSKTPLKFDKDDFVDAAAAGDSKSSSTSSSSTASSSSSSKTSSSTLASQTASATSSPSTASATASPTASPAGGSTEESGKTKLSTAGTIGVAAGVSVAGVAAIAALAFFLVRRRKRGGAADEAHPMLPPEKYGGGGATTFPPQDPSPNLGGGGGFAEHEPKSHYSGSTYSGVPLSQQQQQQRQSYVALPTSTSPELPQQRPDSFLAAWEPPAGASNNTAPGNVQYVGPYAPPQSGGLAELPPQTLPVSNVFELDAQGSHTVPPPSHPPSHPAPQQTLQQQQQQQQQQQPAREYKPYIPN